MSWFSVVVLFRRLLWSPTIFLVCFCRFIFSSLLFSSSLPPLSSITVPDLLFRFLAPLQQRPWQEFVDPEGGNERTSAAGVCGPPPPTVGVRAFTYVSKAFFKIQNESYILEPRSTHPGVLVHLDGFSCVDDTPEETRWQYPADEVTSGAQCEMDCLLERSCEVWQWHRLEKKCRMGSPQIKQGTVEKVRVSRLVEAGASTTSPPVARPELQRKPDGTTTLTTMRRGSDPEKHEEVLVPLDAVAKREHTEEELAQSASHLLGAAAAARVMGLDARLSEDAEHTKLMTARGAEANPLAACMRGPHFNATGRDRAIVGARTRITYVFNDMDQFFGAQQQARGVCSIANSGVVSKDAFWKWAAHQEWKTLNHLGAGAPASTPPPIGASTPPPAEGGAGTLPGETGWNETSRTKYYVNWLRDLFFLRKWADWQIVANSSEVRGPLLPQEKLGVANADEIESSTRKSTSESLAFLPDAHDTMLDTLAVYDRSHWFRPDTVRQSRERRVALRKDLMSNGVASNANKEVNKITSSRNQQLQELPTRVTRDAHRFCAKVLFEEYARPEKQHRSLRRLREVGVPRDMQTGRFLNFGCGRCDAEDPLAEFFFNDENQAADGLRHKAMQGIGFELDAQDAEMCRQQSGQFIDVRVGSVTPENVGALLDETGYFSQQWNTSAPGGSAAPPPIEIVKIDVDSWDFELLEAVVAKARHSSVKVFMYVVEIQGVFPPPLKYHSKYSARKEEKSLETLAKKRAEKWKEQRDSAQRRRAREMQDDSGVDEQEEKRLAPLPGGGPDEVPAAPPTKQGNKIKKRISASTSTSEADAARLAATNLGRFRELALRKSHPHYIGVSLQAAVDLLRPTHSLVMLNGMDAIFVDNEVMKPIVERAYKIYLPVDEELCFHYHEPWHSWREEYIADWLYADLSWRERLALAAGNMTMCDEYWDNPTKEVWPYGVQTPNFVLGLR